MPTRRYTVTLSMKGKITPSTQKVFLPIASVHKHWHREKNISVYCCFNQVGLQTLSALIVLLVSSDQKQVLWTVQFFISSPILDSGYEIYLFWFEDVHWRLILSLFRGWRISLTSFFGFSEWIFVSYQILSKHQGLNTFFLAVGWK